MHVRMPELSMQFKTSEIFCIVIKENAVFFTYHDFLGEINSAFPIDEIVMCLFIQEEILVYHLTYGELDDFTSQRESRNYCLHKNFSICSNSLITDRVVITSNSVAHKTQRQRSLKYSLTFLKGLRVKGKKTILQLDL